MSKDQRFVKKGVGLPVIKNKGKCSQLFKEE